MAVAQTSLCISTDKTTSLIFPFAIKHVDRGTPSVLAQQVRDVPKLLLLKAGAKDFRETNLSVATEDGSVYGFTICYDKNPATWLYHLPVQSKGSVESYANAILDNPASIKGAKQRKWAMQLRVKGIYVKDDILFFQIGLKNDGPLDYDIDLLRFYISDSKKSKRTAVQELDLKPLHFSGNTSTIKASSNTALVVALPKFTIPDAKYFGVQLNERAGGRHLFVKMDNNKLLQAIPLPDLK